MGLSQSFLASTMGLRMAAATPLWTVPTITSTSSRSMSLRTLLSPTLGSAVSSSLTSVYGRPAVGGPPPLAPSMDPAQGFPPSPAAPLRHGNRSPLPWAPAAPAPPQYTHSPHPPRAP